LAEKADWATRAQKGFLASGIDPKDRKGHKNFYIDLLQKMALEEVLQLRGNEVVLDYGCGSGRISYWIAPRVRKVVGLEITSEMIDLARKNRTAENVEFVVYDGIHFPAFPYLFDLILSVGVLQTMRREMLKKTMSQLAQYLKDGGRFYLIEQATDNPRVNRPSVREYLDAFDSSKMDYLQCYPIRKGHWWLLYLMRYGVVPQKSFWEIAKNEILRCRKEKKAISYYRDYLFILKKT
jgi:SAM-dependent methyltransferase